MKFLIVKNITREGPGLLEELLDSYNFGYDIVDLDKGESFPDPSDYSAVIVMGGPDSANDTTPKMREELKRIKEATDAKIPYLGVCLGMQTLVKANGGEVYRNDIKEVGWRDPEGIYLVVDLTDRGTSDPLFAGITSPLNIFHLHGETVRLTRGMRLLATGKYCKNQIVKIGDNAYGIQGHFELTPHMFDEWRTQDPDLTPLDQEALQADYARLRKKYEATGTQILKNFLPIAKLID